MGTGTRTLPWTMILWAVGLSALITASMVSGQAPPGPGVAVAAKELFRLGGAEAPIEQQFSNQLLSLALGPNNQLVVLDVGADRLQVFSVLDGRWVRTISRGGQGPGEIGLGTTIGFDGSGKLWVTDVVNSRYSVFDSTGAFIRSVPRSPVTDPARTGRLRFNDEGQLLEMVVSGGRPAVRVVDPTSGAVLHQYESIPFDAERAEIGQRLFLSLPEATRKALSAFQPWLVWDWTASGEVWFSRTDEYRIVAVNPVGDTVRVIEGSGLRRFTPTEEDLVDQARHRLGREAVGLAPRQLQSIVRLDDGRLLLQRPADLNEPGATFDLLSPEGELLGQLRTPVPIWPQSGVATAGDRVYLVGRGPFDIPIILSLSLEG